MMTSMPAGQESVEGPWSRLRWSRAATTPSACVFMLVVAAAFWGSGNIANKTLLDDIGPLTALALRGTIAALIVLPVLSFDRERRPVQGFYRSGIRVALLFVAAATFQQVAYQWTTVTNAGFLVNTCTVVTPLLAWVILREQPHGRIVVAAIMTLCGAWLMCGAASLGTGINAGDAACLVSALFYAGWAIAIGHHAVQYGCPLTTAFIQFGLAGVLLAPVALALETPTLAGVVAAGPEVLYLAVFCTVGACLLTAIAQRRVSASVAVVLLSLEGVFGAASAYLVLAERPSTEVISGGLLIVIAVVVAVGGRETKASR